MTEFPLVTVVVPMRNEASAIEGFLESLKSQTYPLDKLDVIIVDGMSTDTSSDIVQRFAAEHSWLRLIKNPGIVAAAAMNEGVTASKADIIVRLDCHSHYDRDYVRNSVSLLLSSPEIGVVGGLQAASGGRPFQQTVAAAMREKIASGDASYRTATRATWADTVYLGAWRKQTLVSVGGFDATWKINEDYELNIRLKEAGYQILLSPEVKSTYFPRASASALWRQYFSYGFWRARTVLVHPTSWKPRQMAPPFLVTLIAIAIVLLPWTRFGLVIPGFYVLLLLVAAGLARARSKVGNWLLYVVVFATMHLAWGLGFLLGLVKWGPQRGALVSAKRPS